MYNKQMRIALFFLFVSITGVHASQDASTPGSQELLPHQQSGSLMSKIQQDHDQKSTNGKPRSFFVLHWRPMAFTAFTIAGVVLLMITKSYMDEQTKELHRLMQMLEARENKKGLFDA